MKKLKQEFGNQLGVNWSTQVGKLWFQAMKTEVGETSCDKCAFNNNPPICSFMRNYILGECAADLRYDKTDIHFIERV